MEIQEWHHWWKQDGAAELREILLTSWDPIHVRDAPEARDEYDGYLGPLGSLLRRRATVKGVAEYLAWCEERMGLNAPAESLTPVAEEILGWYSSSIDPVEPPP